MHVFGIYSYTGGRGYLDIQPHWVTVLAFPQHKGLMEGCLGITTDTLLVGRLDGSVAMIDVIDSSSFRRSELQHCSRNDGKIQLIKELLNLRLMFCKKYLYYCISCYNMQSN